MSAYGTFPLLRDPQGSWANTVGAAHTRPRAGVQGNLLHPYHRAVASNPTILLRGCFASLDRFPAPSASVSFCYPHGDGRGVKGDEVVHFTLDALNRPNTHRRGRWRAATCPCGLAREGFGAKPQGLVFCF